MNTINKIAAFAVSLSILIACGDGNKDSLAAKKKELADLQAEQKKIEGRIDALEVDIAKIDTSAARPEKSKLVTTTVLAPGAFTHYIDLQGNVEAENIAYVTPRGPGGQVRNI